MTVQRVYVGDAGGENLDVARATGGKARFEPGDTVTIPNELAKRLDASWATEGDATKQGITTKTPTETQEAEVEATTEASTETATDAEGGDSQ